MASQMVFFSTLGKPYLRFNELILFFPGEVVDAIEKYFWGMRNGLAMEIGLHELRKLIFTN